MKILWTSPHALKAMTQAFELVWRYPDEHADTLIETIAKINGVTRDQIILGDGSGEILKFARRHLPVLQRR
jgi:histidinol-phosphate/aromatic aminotransferase/cobyric acid decarboxylase-like protein